MDYCRVGFLQYGDSGLSPKVRVSRKDRIRIWKITYINMNGFRTYGLPDFRTDFTTYPSQLLQMQPALLRNVR